jgi:hypothetical protein
MSIIAMTQRAFLEVHRSSIHRYALRQVNSPRAAVLRDPGHAFGCYR